jgi:anti-sigma B factor antagonist
MNDVNIVIRSEQIDEHSASVALVGRFDARNAQTVKETLRQLIDGGTIHLIVDLAQVPFIDSAGLATLVSTLKLVRRVGGSVLLAGVQPQARTVFSLTMLDQVFTIHPTVEAALASLSG